MRIGRLNKRNDEYAVHLLPSVVAVATRNSVYIPEARQYAVWHQHNMKLFGAMKLMPTIYRREKDGH
jgi:hypothetical protein